MNYFLVGLEVIYWVLFIPLILGLIYEGWFYLSMYLEDRHYDAFKFVAVAHEWSLLQEWITDTKRWSGAIQEETAEYEKYGTLEAGTFRRNEDNCYGKYSKCSFLNICSTCSDPTKLSEVPAGYVEERWEPFDVLKLDKLIKGV